MPTPSQLSIATSSLQRLIKEEASYHSELAMQQKSIDRLERLRTTGEEAGGEQGQGQEHEQDAEDERGNHEFLLKQERRALEETKAVFPRLRERIEEARGNLEGLLASAADGDPDADKARQAIEDARVATR